MGSNIYNVPSILGSTLGFIALITVSILLEQVKLIGTYVSFIGRNSMVFLIIHALDIDCLRNWNRVSWPFVIATFVIYSGVTYLYVTAKKG